MILIFGRPAFFFTEQRRPTVYHVPFLVNIDRIVDTIPVNFGARWLMNRLAVVQTYIYAPILSVYRSRLLGIYQEAGRLVSFPNEGGYHETLL